MVLPYHKHDFAHSIIIAPRITFRSGIFSSATRRSCTRCLRQTLSNFEKFVFSVAPASLAKSCSEYELIRKANFRKNVGSFCFSFFKVTPSAGRPSESGGERRDCQRYAPRITPSIVHQVNHVFINVAVGNNNFAERVYR